MAGIPTVTARRRPGQLLLSRRQRPAAASARSATKIVGELRDLTMPAA